MDFWIEYLKVIEASISNNYNDNWDFARYGPEPKSSWTQKISDLLRRKLNRRGFFNLRNFVQNDADQVLKFKFLYENLTNEEDKKLLLQVLAFRMIGHKKVKLPLNTQGYWKKLEDIRPLFSLSDQLDPKFLHFLLSRVNLNDIGYPIDFYFTEQGVMTDFIVKQYEYNKDGKVIKSEIGDIVIDGGACWGDTALYFANEVGKEGKVYSFEFIPNNIGIFEKNISLNPNLKKRIELVRNPLWSDSSTKMYFQDFGPGSRVSMDAIGEHDEVVGTLSIDDLALRGGVKKIDFIKLDIEGAEKNALMGSVNTIRQYKPKLAVALYHSVDDFEGIPKLVKDILPEYNLYFSHSTIYGEESMLFASIN